MSNDFFREQGDILMESARIMMLDVSLEKKSPDVNRDENERTRTKNANERESERASDRKLSISKSIWPGLPIGCRLISRWIVSNMGILLMARRGIGCTSNRRGLQPRSRALPKSIARGWAICSCIRYSGLNALWCCCNGGGAIASPSSAVYICTIAVPFYVSCANDNIVCFRAKTTARSSFLREMQKNKYMCKYHNRSRRLLWWFAKYFRDLTGVGIFFENIWIRVRKLFSRKTCGLVQLGTIL